MKYLILVFALAITACKKGPTWEELVEQCPEEYKYKLGSYYLNVPMEIIPHQKTYQKGDTIKIRMLFSDSIYDLNYERHYKITDFPFKPVFSLYRIEEDSWLSGLKLDNPVIADAKFNIRHVGNGNTGGVSYASDIRGDTQYENGTYHFEFLIVMNTPGVYITFVQDIIRTRNHLDIVEGLYPEYLIEFEGKCLDYPNLKVCTVVEGDPHYFDFGKEVQYLDQEVYLNNLAESDNKNKEFWGWGGSQWAANYVGLFAFEVVE